MSSPAKLYRTKQPSAPFLVTYIDPTRTKHGRSYRVRKYFRKEEDAVDYQNELNERLNLIGVAGVQWDQAARADYSAARTLLDSQGHTTINFLELARDFVARTLTTKSLKITEARDQFLEDQRRSNRSEITVRNLEIRINKWLRMVPIQYTMEIRKEHLECLLAQKVTVATKINDLSGISSFCTWLVYEGALEDNPCKKIRRPRDERRRPPIWTPAQCHAVLTAGQQLPTPEERNGLACLVLAGLRPSEVQHSRIFLDKQPCVKVEGGKLRGRANRIIPLPKAHLAWFTATIEGRKEGTAATLTRNNRDLTVERARKWLYKNHPGEPKLGWRPDTPRHTWISQRLALSGDENLTAKEAGNSPSVIYRHYHKLMSTSEAKAFTFK